MHLENKSVGSTVRECVTYTKFEGLKLMKPYKGESYELEVKPGESKTLLIKQVDNKGYALASASTVQVQMSDD